ncbi:MAG: type III-B CRISPR module-associated protein Cmr5 [Chromatiaceae bacterium]|nr:type III-B CRISPR module-associated protein Cmr5 [Chromatiaceae bacterium]
MIRSHRVATAAYERVTARQNADNQKKYGAIAHKLPGMILQNGLAQATGFLLAKGASAPEHLMLLDDLKEVLRAGGALDVPDHTALHTAIIGTDLAQTLKLTRAALDASGWIKRYVQGVLRVDATGAAVEQNTEQQGN